MLIDALLVVGGLVVLTYAADQFVLGSARLAAALRISAVVVGAVVIGLGTSAPEFVITTLATLEGSQDLAFGNIVGSNIANLLLVLGVAGVVAPVAVRTTTMRRELPLMVGALLLLAAVAFDGLVTTVEALLLLVAAGGAITFTVVVTQRDRAARGGLEAEVAGLERDRRPSVPREALRTLLGLLGTLAGAQLLVTGATGVAEALGVSEGLIGLTVVAVGTSLPELVTAAAAARRGETDLVVGNVLGSNIFNSLPVAGVAGLLDTSPLEGTFGPSLLIMLGACAVATAFLRTGHRLGRREGVVLLTLFAAATGVTVLVT